MNSNYIYVKRILDFIFSTILLILLIPLFIIVSILIKVDSKGPVFFKQERTGLNGEIFVLIKFRSMAEDNDIFDFERGDRVTKVGRFIRAYSIDELPQLINIIKGEMSFIGPRPWVTECYKYFTPYQKKRNLVLPGVTGLAQTSGRKDLNILKRIDYDVEYVNKISLMIDIKILIKTIFVILNGTDNTRNNYTFEEEINDLKQNFLAVTESGIYEN